MQSKLIQMMVSLVVIALLLIVSISIVRALGFWPDSPLKVISLTSIGFAIYFLFFSYFVKKFGANAQQFISRKLIARLHWAAACVCLLLAIVTGFLMWRNSYNHDAIINVTSVYIAISCYFFGGIYGLHRSQYL